MLRGSVYVSPARMMGAMMFQMASLSASVAGRISILYFATAALKCRRAPQAIGGPPFTNLKLTTFIFLLRLEKFARQKKTRRALQGLHPRPAYPTLILV